DPTLPPFPTRRSSDLRIITLTPKVFIQYFILPTYIRIHVGVKSILNDTHFHIVIQRRLPASGMRFVCKHCIVISAKVIWQPVKARKCSVSSTSYLYPVNQPFLSGN